MMLDGTLKKLVEIDLSKQGRWVLVVANQYVTEIHVPSYIMIDNICLKFGRINKVKQIESYLKNSK